MALLDHPAGVASGAELLDLVGDAIVSADEDGRILLFNRAAEEMFGHRAVEVLGQSIEILLPERLRDAHARDVRAFARGAVSARRVMGHSREVVGLRRDGTEFTLEATLSHRRLSGRTILTVVMRDISERKRFEQELEARNLALIESEKRLRLALKGGDMGAWEWNLETNELHGDETARQLWGLSESLPLSIEKAFAQVYPQDLPGLMATLERAVADGEDCHNEFRVTASAGTTRWVACKGTVQRDSGGRAQAMFGVAFDVTERRSLEEQRRLLLGEVNHRMKNMMALIGAVVNLSARGAESIETYRRALLGRLGAVAATQQLLMQRDWRGTTLAEQLATELEPFRNGAGSNIILDGPPIALHPQDGLSIGLIFHELATNAVKYGALSTPNGRVSVKWTAEETPQGQSLALCWQETGGPAVSKPSQNGFGTTLIEKSVMHSLGGTVLLDFRPDGLTCTVTLPAVLERAANEPGTRRTGAPQVQLRRQT